MLASMKWSALKELCKYTKKFKKKAKFHGESHQPFLLISDMMLFVSRSQKSSNCTLRKIYKNTPKERLMIY